MGYLQRSVINLSITHVRRLDRAALGAEPDSPDTVADTTLPSQDSTSGVEVGATSDEAKK